MANESRKNLTPHDGTIDRHVRENIIGQKGCVIWLTGLSGSGKSTIAREVEKKLSEAGHLVYVLDGDNIRCGLNNDLGFSPSGRRENIRRIGEVAALFADAGVITLVAFISPYRNDRASARKKTPKGTFIEIHVFAPMETCMERDPKGLYKKSKKGEVEYMTGIDAPYQEPDKPEISIHTQNETPVQSAKIIVEYLERNGFLCPPAVGEHE